MSSRADLSAVTLLIIISNGAVQGSHLLSMTLILTSIVKNIVLSNVQKVLAVV